MLWTVCLLASCHQVKIFDPDLNEIEGWEDFQSDMSGVSGTPRHIPIIVKFYNEEDKDYVCVGHRLLSQAIGETIPDVWSEDTLGLADYYERYTSHVISSTFPSQPISTFAEDVLSICGTSPYMELGDGYYLINWRWAQFARPAGLTPELPKHCFLSKTRWEDLTSLSTTWLPKEVSKNPFKEVICVYLICLDLYRGAYESYEQQYMGWGRYSYDLTMNAAWAYKYYTATPEELAKAGRTYDEYVQYCDSMYVVYQESLSEAIAKGDLHKFAKRYVYD